MGMIRLLLTAIEFSNKRFSGYVHEQDIWGTKLNTKNFWFEAHEYLSNYHINDIHAYLYWSTLTQVENE